MHLVNTTHITLVAQTVESDQGEVKISKHWQKKKDLKTLRVLSVNRQYYQQHNTVVGDNSQASFPGNREIAIMSFALHCCLDVATEIFPTSI